MTVAHLSAVTTAAQADTRRNLVAKLQSMMLDAQAGRLTEFLCVSVVDGNFVFSRAACSKMDAVGYSALLHQQCMQDMKVAE